MANYVDQTNAESAAWPYLGQDANKLRTHQTKEAKSQDAPTAILPESIKNQVYIEEGHRN